MAHPIVIMAYDKSPAITKAVAALEEAGNEVIVLNTSTAKLVNFLGALAGEVEDEDTPPEDEGAEEEPKEEPKKAPPEEAAPEETSPEGEEEEESEPIATEAVVNGEKVLVELVAGNSITLHANKISTGAKTFYSLNESHYSFWPNSVSDEPITGSVELELNGDKHFTKVVFSEETRVQPTIKIGREWLKEAGYPRDSWSLLPASQVLYGKNKVGIEDIRKEMGNRGVILVCTRNDGHKDQFPVLLTSYGSIAEPGTKHDGHHDQSWRKLGTFTVVGTIKLGKTVEDDVVKYMSGADGKFDPKTVKGPVFVFK